MFVLIGSSKSAGFRVPVPPSPKSCDLDTGTHELVWLASDFPKKECPWQ